MGYGYKECKESAWDWVSEYSTPMNAVVKNPCLGVLHVTCKIIIVFYIAIYAMYMQKKYLDFEEPLGLQRSVVEDPCTPLHRSGLCAIPPKEGTPCMNGMCFPPHSFRCDTHHYCAQKDTPDANITGETKGALPCRFWDHNSIVSPPAEAGAFTIASRASLINQRMIDLEKLHAASQDLVVPTSPPTSNPGAKKPPPKALKKPKATPPKALKKPKAKATPPPTSKPTKAVTKATLLPPAKPTTPAACILPKGKKEGGKDAVFCKNLNEMITKAIKAKSPLDWYADYCPPSTALTCPVSCNKACHNAGNEDVKIPKEGAAKFLEEGDDFIEDDNDEDDFEEADDDEDFKEYDGEGFSDHGVARRLLQVHEDGLRGAMGQSLQADRSFEAMDGWVEDTSNRGGGDTGARDVKKERTTMHKSKYPLCDNQKDPMCQWYPPTRLMEAQKDWKSGLHSYIADYENFTVKVSHSMWGPNANIRMNSADMEGYLMKCKPGADCTQDESWETYKKLPKNGKADHILVSDILHAITPSTGQGVHGPGLKLDDISDACPDKCHGLDLTYRFMGFISTANIDYDNTGLNIEGSSADLVKYTIKMFHLPRSIASIQVVQRGSNEGYGANHRTIHALNGLRVVFMAGGKLGWFDLQNFVLVLVSMVGLLALASIVVDWFMTSCFMGKKAAAYDGIVNQDKQEDVEKAEGIEEDDKTNEEWYRHISAPKTPK